MNQLPYYQLSFPTINSLYSIPQYPVDDNSFFQSNQNQNKCRYTENSVTNYLKNKDIYNNPNCLPSYEHVGQIQRGYIQSKSTEQYNFLNQKCYDFSQIFHLVPKPTFSENMYQVHFKTPNFDISRNFRNHSLDSLPIYLTNNYNMQKEKWIQTNKNYSTINSLKKNDKFRNNQDLIKTNIINSPINNIDFNGTTPTTNKKEERFDEFSDFVPTPGSMSYPHPIIPVIPNTRSKAKTNYHIILEYDYVKRIHEIHKINNKSKDKKESKKIKHPIKIIAVRSPIWTSKEDQLLRDLKGKQNLSWRDISLYFPTRTINACQFRWRRLTIREANKLKVKQKGSIN